MDHPIPSWRTLGKARVPPWSNKSPQAKSLAPAKQNDAGECWQPNDFVADQRALKRKGADYHHGDLRRSLVEATVRLVAEHGMDGFTLRAAAKLAGVSDGAPYHHFADKEALLAAVAEESFDLLCEEMSAAGAEQPGSACEKSQAMSVAYVLFASRYPARFRIMWSPIGRGRRYRGLKQAAERADRLLRRCLGRCLRGDSTRAAPDRNVVLARAVVHGLSVLAIDGHLKPDGLSERALKRIAWDAIRQLNPPDRVLDAPRQSKRAPRPSIAPESAPRSTSRLRATRQSA
jgi:AcrR family transcriptional regulator